MPRISLIILRYFNAENIPVTVQELVANEGRFPAGVSFEYVFVHDASPDQTLAALLPAQAAYPDRVRVVDLVGNVGSYNAIVAGMAHATGDCLAVMAADLQDPPELLAIKSTEVLRLHERNSNVFYLMIWLGYASGSLPYVRRPRQIGRSRWTLGKKIKLLIDSLLASSFFPIRAISAVGLGLGVAAFAYSLSIIGLRLLGSHASAGWSALMVVLLFISAFQMIALGVIGEYVWRGLDAARQRPLYAVNQVYEPVNS